MSFRPKVRNRVKKEVGVASLTQQHHKEQCDVNSIMKKYRNTGLIEHVSRYQGSYGDFVNAPDYHTALNKMIEADAMFLTVPSDIRELFDNDPGRFLEFVMNDENEDEMRELGLLPKRPKEPSPEAAEAPLVKKPPEAEPASVEKPQGAS